MSDIILKTENLRTYFAVRGGMFMRIQGWVRAVDGVSLQVERGETLGFVGESGCGKTTLGKTILRLVDPIDGSIYFENMDISKLSAREMRKVRRDLQMVFQNPQSSLDPRMTVLSLIGEPILVHGLAKGRELREKVLKLLEVVGLTEDQLSRYPHEFSGGQRQRIGIARALALRPKLVILDEPTSSLDVSVQAQILNLIKDLQRTFSLTYVIISHDIAVVRYVSDRIAVMYAGEIVEMGLTNEILTSPLHPYTQALLSAVPRLDLHSEIKRITLSGDVPSATNTPTGCRFHPRCSQAMDICRTKIPRLIDVGGKHLVMCHLYK